MIDMTLIYLILNLSFFLLLYHIITDERILNLLILLIVFEGFSITIISSTHLPRYYGYILIFFGCFLWLKSKEYVGSSLEGQDWESSSVAWLLSPRQYLIQYFPIIGFSILLVDLISINFLYNNYMGNLDFLILLLSFVWILYKYIGDDFMKERDFIFIFMNVFTAMFVLPKAIAIAITGYSTDYSEGWFVEFFLANPVANLLNILGYNVFTNHDVIIYEDLTTGLTNSVWVARSCSGIQSVMVFISGFTAYILNERIKFGNFPSFVLVIGVLIAYFANLLRMAIIILVGHYWGSESLLWTHKNIGWVIFSLWIIIFWSILTRYLPHPKP